ncbi:class I SAM-dependent methyltransferase [Photobacterium sp. ZSDE20]|uniref:class I SAM-dependent methyltransferase n=1 Tax=unclassified Vibrio TaxID=2614977 RepID=UPI00224956E2|nr:MULTISPECIES: class I SAM-dependent methyltransferase [unclassified Vibrio]MCX2756968.1 class I SAM-dependent methyltransferase [Vibrio sp. 14G-20]MCX2773929.1 class I SAM-dependent methyltransferase [Vibrio sp. Sgm 22]MDD1822316.1 class I SAM-dependent methyltransferase [Photobacterium sp. ZSDE20]
MRINKDEDKEWLDYLSRFSDEYDERVYESSTTGYVMRAGHIACEKPFSNREHFSKVLEVGSGTGEHLRHVQHSFDEYTVSDGDSAALEVAKKQLSNTSTYDKLVFNVTNARALDFESNSFDRVIATHILEHLYEPHLVIKEWLRVLKPGGTLSILIPTDPGIAWKVGRYMTTRKLGVKKGWNYDYIMAREHVNPCNNLIAFLKYYLPDNKHSFWPLSPIPLIDCNLFFNFHGIKPAS